MMKDRAYLSKENKKLKARLAEAKELLVAIRNGAVDAIVTDDQKVFTLRSSDHAYRVLVETMNEGAATLMLDGTVMYCNSCLMEMLGLPIEKIIGRRIYDFVDPAELPKFQSILLRSANETPRDEFWLKKNNKTFLPVLVACNSLKLENAGICIIITDLTRQKNAEGSMKAALLEKEVMLKEIHHRVKNNLQIISSLLRLQSDTIQDKRTAALFLESQERVRAMAMVHEYLYKSPDLARINFQAYVASLVRNLYRTFGSTPSEHPPILKVDDVLLDLDMAVPCGLLLTELVSNAVKYAYPEKKQGPITICFRKQPEGFFEMSVADEGVGFPENFDWTKSGTLGLRLINLLTEQLQGKIVLEQGPGIKFTITFKS